jgi:hypothetical protein
MYKYIVLRNKIHIMKWKLSVSSVEAPIFSYVTTVRKSVQFCIHRLRLNSNSQRVLKSRRLGRVLHDYIDLVF